MVLGFIFALSSAIFKKIFIDANQDLTLGFIAAFMGAFFAFLFSRIAEALTRIYDRFSKNRNALVQIERQMAILYNETQDNIFVIDGFLKAIQNKTSE